MFLLHVERQRNAGGHQSLVWLPTTLVRKTDAQSLDATHPHLEQHPLFDGRLAAVKIGEQDAVIVRNKPALLRFQQIHKKRNIQRSRQKPRRMGASPPQSLGQGIGLIPHLGGRRYNPRPRLLGYPGTAVQGQ